MSEKGLNVVIGKLGYLFDPDYYYAILRRDRGDRNIIIEYIQKAFAILVVSIVRFFNDNCFPSAAALTYYTIFAIIPLLAIVFAIARSFGAYDNIEYIIRDFFTENSHSVDQIVEFANHALEHASGGLIAGIGVIILLWSIIKMLNNAEMIMNDIWRLKKGRNIRKMFTDYLSLIIIAPILIIIGSSINVFLQTNLEAYLPLVSRFVIRLLKLSPYVLIWGVFIFLFTFMPATRVRFKYAFWAGIIAGTLFLIVQWYYVRFQVGMSSYNAIYGSLAALPLLLVWLQVSWGIILWGCELCYILTNRHFMYKNELYGDEPWMAMVESAIRILRFIFDEYMNGGKDVSLNMITSHFKINSSKIQLVLDELIDRGILVESKVDNEYLYLPVGEYQNISVADIILELSRIGEGSDKEWNRRFSKAINQEFAKDKLV